MKTQQKLTHEAWMLLAQIEKHLGEERRKHTFDNTKKGLALWWACMNAQSDLLTIMRQDAE